MSTTACSNLSFTILGGCLETEFYLEDLIEVASQPDCARIVFLLATCNYLTTEHSGCDASRDGSIHTVAIGEDSSGALMKANYIAALPCPPHCGGKGTLVDINVRETYVMLSTASFFEKIKMAIRVLFS